MGMVRGKTGIVKMPKSSAVRANIAAGLPDFLFDLKLQVLSFKVKVPGQLTANVSGGSINAKAASIINKARRGDIVTFYDIKAKVTNSGYQIKESNTCRYRNYKLIRLKFLSMKLRRFYMILFVFATIGVANAQSNLLNAKKADEIGVKSDEQKAVDKDKPLPYGYIADRDVLWSKVVWEYIDLNQKINLPYYYPVDTTNAPANRRSLFDTLLKGVKSGKIKEVYIDSYFTSKVNIDELDQLLVNQRQNGDYVDNYEIKSDLIEGYMIKVFGI